MVDSKDIEWKKFKEDLLIKNLVRDDSRDLQMDIVKIPASLTFSEHSHPAVEWVYVLEGSLSDDRGTYKKGHFIHNEKGSTHTVVSGSEGCVILVVWCGRIIKD